MKIYFCENCGKDYSVKQFQEVDLDIYSYVCDAVMKKYIKIINKKYNEAKNEHN